MRVVLVAVLLFPALVLAGCVGGDEASPDPVAPTETQTAAAATPDDAASPSDDGDAAANVTASKFPGPGYAFGCRVQAALVPLAPDQVTPYMPAGFRPAPYAGAVPGVAGGLLFGNACSNATLDGTDVPGWREALVGVLVEPPADLADDTVDEDYVVIGLASSGPFVDAYRHVGILAEPVETFALSTLRAAESTTGTLVAAAGGMDFTIRSAAASQGEIEPFTVRFIGAQNGTAIGAVTFALQGAPSQDMGSAVVQMSGETLFGTDGAVGAAIHYTWPENGFAARQVFTLFEETA